MSALVLLGLIIGARCFFHAMSDGVSPHGAPPGVRPHRGLLALRLLFVPVALGVAFSIASGILWAAPLLALAIVVLLPWPVARWVLIPLGLPRVAYHAASLADWTFLSDRRGGAALAAAWALCRGGRRDDETATWLEEKLNEAPPPAPADEDTAAALRQKAPHFEPLRGAGIAAAAMIAAHRGDIAGARALFESVSTLDERACPAVARRVARRWLAAEAASRGDWQRVADLSTDGLVEGRDLALLGAIAARLLDAVGAPSDAGLWVRWIVAPRRQATLPLVRRALAQRPAPAPLPREEGPDLAAAVAEGDRWGRAVALHASLMLRPDRVSGDDLRRLGGAWDAAFEDEVAQAELAERALSLGAASAAAALGGLRRSAAEDLAALAREARLPHGAWEDLGETVTRAGRLLRDELLAEIELVCDRLRARVDERRELPATDEWREFVALRALYERAAELSGMELRRLAFPKVNADVCHLAVWLFNVRRQRTLSNAMFRWLLAEAEALGDERAANLARNNIGCGV